MKTLTFCTYRSCSAVCWLCTQLAMP